MTEQPASPGEPFCTKLRIYSRTDVGKRRQRNEDALGVIARHGIFVVADGMGGVDGGDYSSRKVVDTLNEAFSGPAAKNLPYEEKLEKVEQAVCDAGARIKEEAEKRGISGMGTTVVALVLDTDDPSRACVMHVGDSRLYRCRGRSLQCLTVDHSLAAESGIQDSSMIPMFMAGVITRAVGVKSEVEVDCAEFAVEPGDLFLLCSDGLYNMVQVPHMEKILQRDPLDPAAELVRAANEAGGFDNITVILVQLPGEPGPPGNLDDTVSD